MGRSLRILLVEDHLDTQQMMLRLLVAFGHDVKTAATMNDALSTAGASPFDVVICDLGLPDGSGAVLMQQLHARFGLRGIALTGYGADDDIAEGASAAFVAHLTKPVSFDQLQQTLLQFGA